MKLLFRLVIQTIVLVIFAGCIFVASYASSSDVRFVSGKSALKIPFESHNNQIYLQISINGARPSWFVLDTGARTLLSRSATQRLGLKIQEQGQIQSTGESSAFKVASTKDISFKLPGATFIAQNVAVIAFEDLEKCLNYRT